MSGNRTEETDTGGVDRLEPTQCHLVFLSGPEAGQARTFDAERVLIGRASSCDLQFDPYQELSVASQHAEILLDNGVFSVHDLSTRSGTYVNGERITRPQPLRQEDYLQFGRNGPEVIFRTGPAVEGLQPLPPEVPPSGEVEFLSGADEGKVFVVHGDRPTRVGRRNDLEVPLDPRGDMIVSGNHCTIVFDKGVFTIADSSRNGTFVNGAPVRGRAYLNHDDIVTLGEGGPRMRFRVHPPERVYPNRPRPARTASAPLPPQPIEAPKPETVSGRAQTVPTEVSPLISPSREPERPAPPVLAEVPPSGTLVEPSLTADPVPGASRLDTAPVATAGIPEFHEAPSRPTARFGSWIVRVLILLAVVVVGGSLAYYVRKGGARKDAGPVPADYQKDIDAASIERCTLGHFQIRLPRDWARSESGFCVSMESSDKLVTVDYVRDPRLSDASVRAIFATGGHAIAKTGRGKSGDVPIEWYIARGGDRVSFAVLHTPLNSVPALALMITPADVFMQLPDNFIASLCITGFKLQDLPPAAVTRLPTPPSAGRPPDTSIASAALPRPPVATSAPSPTATPTPPPAPPVNQVVSRPLGIKLDLPADWKGTAEDKEGIIKIQSPDRINISIGRDAKKLEPRAVFDAMKGEGWTVVTINQPRQIPDTSRFVAVADMTKGNARLRLYLLDQPDGSTLVVYAVHDGKPKPEQWVPVTQIVSLIAAQTDKAAQDTRAKP